MKNEARMPRRWETVRELISPSLIFSILALLAALFLGVAIGRFSPVASAVVVGTLIMLIVVLLRLDELTVTLIVAVHIFIDSYLGLAAYQIAMIMALVLLLVCYIGRSANHPWTGPRSIWIWVLFLILNIYPTINGGAFGLINAIGFYIELVPSAFIIFWLGNIIAKDTSAVQRVFQLLSVLAALIAIHTIIGVTTGKFLFETTRVESTLAQYSNFQLAGTAVSRSASFFGNPNGNGAFLATSFFLPLGLIFIESKQLWAKLLYLLETLLILAALVFTYSTGSWIAVLVGIVAFMLLMGRIRVGLLLLLLIAMLAAIALVIFPSQIAVQLGHARDQNDILLHLGSWQTAVRVIQAYPLFGVGLGSKAYLVLANPFRVPTQTALLAEPDNSYLQWGAIAGIPVMLVFLLLLGLVFWFAWRNWRAIDIRYRSLLAGGITAVIALSINSLTVDGWTSAGDLVYLGWLIAGIVASPLIGRCLRQQSAPPFDKTAEIVHVQAQKPRMGKAKRG